MRLEGQAGRNVIGQFMEFLDCFSPLRTRTNSLGEANDTARSPPPSIASLLRVRRRALADVVGAGVQHHCAPNDAELARQLHPLVGDGALGLALGVRLDVA